MIRGTIKLAALGLLVAASTNSFASGLLFKKAGPQYDCDPSIEICVYIHGDKTLTTEDTHADLLVNAIVDGQPQTDHSAVPPFGKHSSAVVVSELSSLQAYGVSQISFGLDTVEGQPVTGNCTVSFKQPYVGGVHHLVVHQADNSYSCHVD